MFLFGRFELVRTTRLSNIIRLNYSLTISFTEVCMRLLSQTVAKTIVEPEQSLRMSIKVMTSTSGLTRLIMEKGGFLVRDSGDPPLLGGK